jgi:hypothetical protein
MQKPQTNKFKDNSYQNKFLFATPTINSEYKMSVMVKREFSLIRSFVQVGQNADFRIFGPVFRFCGVWP